jgi:drug/metabolite transporter (DMT)-like permease
MANCRVAGVTQMETVKNHWLTALTLVGTTFLVVVGIALIVTGGDDNDGAVRVFGVMALLGALAILAGLQACVLVDPKRLWRLR